MEKFWSLIVIIIGLLILIGSIKKSEFILFKLIVARAKILWGNSVYLFLMISGIFVMIFGVLMFFGVLNSI